MSDQRKRISIVTPCWNEEDNVGPCYEAIKHFFETDLAGYDREHIFCDNASTDQTVVRLREIAAADPCVKVILNSRNFGPSRSTFNAMLRSSGDAVVCLLPVDLQDPPEVITQFVRKWEEGYQVVYGVRKSREEGLAMVLVRRTYYRMVSRLADITIPTNVGDFQLIDRVVLEALRKCDDYYPYIRGMIASCGFNSCGVEYAWKARARGFSKNRLYHLIDQGLNGLISFSNVPMRLCLFLGAFLSGLSMLYAVITIILTLVRRFAFGQEVAPAGIPTLVAAIFFFSGVQLLFLGVIGEYVSAIHYQVRKRPLVIEKERINFD